MKPLNLPFVDAAKLSKQHPDTFFVPSTEEIELVKPEQFVKVCLDEPGIGGERFWCQVISNDQKTKLIVAEINNHLVSYDLEVGTKVEIKYRNVYAIYE